MNGYARSWRQEVKFVEFSYGDFVYFLLSNPSKKFYFSHKVDGELAALVHTNDETFFQTKKVVRDRPYPVIDEYKDLFKKKNISTAIVTGELVAKKGNKYLMFNKSQSVIQTGDMNLVHHFVFDIYSINGKKITFTSFNDIENLIGKKYQHIHIPKWSFGGLKQFKNLWNKIVEEEEHEGIVAREPRSKILYRIKPTLTVDAVLVGGGAPGMKGWDRGELSYMRIVFMNERNNFLLTSKVGSGWTTSERKKLFTWLEKNKIQEMTNGEIWVKPTKVVEVQYRRFRQEPVPEYEFKKDWKFVGNSLGVMMDQVTFKRFRPDKNVSHEDVSILQFPLK